uniref:Lipoprotein n=1 Tax=Thermodesulfovibrio aggregans TaxID=86166 RepID=A0A7C4AK00_9BACT
MKKYLIFIIVTFFLFSCGGKKKIKPYSEEYTYTIEAFKVVEEIRQAYQNKDNSGIRKNCSESAYREIIASVHPFDRAELDFTPVLGEMEGGIFRLYVSWNGKWIYSEKETEERGLAVFLIKGNPPKVEKILRGNPFRYPD